MEIMLNLVVPGKNKNLRKSHIYTSGQQFVIFTIHPIFTGHN